MFESCNFPSLDSCQKRFLWTNKDVHVFQVGVLEKFSLALGFESLDLFFSQQAGSMLHSQEDDGSDKRLVKL